MPSSFLHAVKGAAAEIHEQVFPGQLKLSGVCGLGDAKDDAASRDAAGEACQEAQAAEAEAEEGSADLMAHSARERAIHEAWKHIEKATELSKEAAETALQAANESLQARRHLDQHDVIAIESQTQDDIRKAEMGRGAEVSHQQMPFYVPAPSLELRSVAGGTAPRPADVSTFL
mmetsp:Transcript_62541/g.116277  ORF Transcript_62541/g.116277 Transcript_62541/m.116277 type:complete len:174 (+) Transcript_62541:86-607(+)